MSQTVDAIRDRIGASLRQLLAGEREPRELSPEPGLFGPDSDYFGPDQTHMVNFRVDDLDGVLAILEEQGHEVLKQVDEPNGRFAHVGLPGGFRVELWEPPKQTGD